MGNNAFCTTIHCMDGRIQEPVNRFMKEQFGAEFVDSITLPGPEKILGSEREEGSETERIRQFVSISIKKHRSVVVAVFAHYDCAGNPVSREVQFEQVRESVKRVRTWFDHITVKGYYVNQEWQIEEIVS